MRNPRWKKRDIQMEYININNENFSWLNILYYNPP